MTRAPRLVLPADYRNADALDYALTLGGFTGAAVMVLGFRRTGDPNWDSPILFDTPVRDALLGSSAGRRAYGIASDISVSASIGWVAFDALGLAWAIDRNPRVARELFWMDTEAYALTLLVTNVVKTAVLRRRPYGAECDRDANYDPHCNGKEENVSFFSSHSATAATSAGLLCAQHTYLRSYGGAADPVACAGALGLMTATGLLRIASDNHWASDVVLGYAVGLASGYGLPLLLHFKSPLPRRARDGGFRVQLLPWGDASRLSLFALGTF